MSAERDPYCVPLDDAFDGRFAERWAALRARLEAAASRPAIGLVTR